MGKIKFIKEEGELISVKKYFKTNITSSGGGGFGDGYISAPNIKSEISVQTDLFLITENKEFSITVYQDLSLREGNKVLAIAASNGVKSHWVAFKNYDTNVVDLIFDDIVLNDIGVIRSIYFYYINEFVNRKIILLLLLTFLTGLLIYKIIPIWGLVGVVFLSIFTIRFIGIYKYEKEREISVFNFKKQLDGILAKG